MVPFPRIERSSTVLQTGAITILAQKALLVRTAGDDPATLDWQSST